MSDRDEAMTAANVWSHFRTQIAILTAAFFLLVGFQTVQLLRERSNLANVRSAQEPTIQEGLKLRSQLDGLASGAAKLAADGDIVVGDRKRERIFAGHDLVEHSAIADLQRDGRIKDLRQ